MTHDAIVQELHVTRTRRLRRLGDSHARHGYRAVCSCGWVGPHTYARDDAERDRREHLVGAWHRDDPWHR